MNSFAKSVKCFNCSKHYLIENINFPENVFELIRQHRLDQNLFWICDSCKLNISDLKKSFAFDAYNTPVPYRDIDVHTPYTWKKSVKKSDEIDCGVIKDEILFAKSPSSSCERHSSSSRSPSPPNKDRSARKYTQAILKAIKIPSDEQSKNKSIIRDVLETLLKHLKRNEIFKVMYNEPYYTGSAYNDTKITSATEYDIDFVLRVPKYVTLTPEFFDRNQAFVKLKWESASGVADSSLKFFTENSVQNYLSPQKVLSWLQRHIDLTLKENLEWPTGVRNVVTSASGPARTIVISTDSECNISIDLVPVFKFEYSALSSRPFYDKVEEIAVDGSVNNFFFAVPKECTEETNISVSDSKLCWRLDFPNAEKKILAGKECAKNVIKILKILRDKKDFKALASYYLKMVVILEVVKDSSKEYWTNGNLPQRTFDCLKQLVNYLFQGDLPHFLTQQNLIQKFNKGQCISWSNNLKNVIKSWEADPANIAKFLENDKYRSESCEADPANNVKVLENIACV